jgi:tyrosyl-tRNA synthetase
VTWRRRAARDGSVDARAGQFDGLYPLVDLGADEGAELRRRTADRLSAYDYWQFWRNTEDADVGRFLRLFTDLDLAEIARLDALGGAEINEAKKILATLATALCHGEQAGREAAETARKAFEEGEAADTLPSITVAAAELEAGISVVKLFVDAGLAASNGEARRLIRGGGARVNDAAVSDESALVGSADLVSGAVKLSAGRKQHRLVRPI